LKVDNCICQEIVDELPLAQPTISQHLKELKNAGLIKGEIEGTAICYCLDLKTWKKFEQHVGRYFVEIERKKDCC
ncbi:MAG: ArsR/SmtB family transcription factor, partial [Flavobacteriales bacterium]